MNECGYVPSSKTLFTETIGKPDMAHSHSFPDPWSGVQVLGRENGQETDQEVSLWAIL